MIVNYRIFIFKAATESLFFTIMVILSIKKLTAANAKFMSERKKRRLDLMMVAKGKKAEAKKQMKIFRPRRVEDQPNYAASDWGRMLKNDRIKDPLDRKGGKLFRRRFRVPYPIFIRLVQITRDSDWFSEKKNCAGRQAAPLELKILSVLRVLGRGYCFDGVEELTLISAEVLRQFFHRFCFLFAKEKFADYCSHPTSEDEITTAMEVYTKLGLPGCIGSTDCVHVRWERCPAGQRSFHKGKEGYPTLSYEVTVDHTKRIMAATQGHPGARNDKTIVKFDGFVTNIHKRKLYPDVPYTLCDAQGHIIQEKGLYLIVDGGYHKWRCLQCPLKHTSKSNESLWSRWVESVRKDVECTFGILKGRFRCLKLPIYYHDKDCIDNMFFTCCILHNLLLTVDGLDKRWESDVNWAVQDGHHHDEDMYIIFRNHYRRHNDATPRTDFSRIGFNAVQLNYRIAHTDEEEEVEDTHAFLRKKLITHFCFQYQNKKIRWLK